MDLSVTGKFIKEQRKAKNLTQLELAEKLLVSEKTISKWECGNGFPDTALILPLCKELDITANELLSGEKLNSKTYVENAESNLIELKAQNEYKAKFLLNLEIVLGYISSVFLFSLVLVAAYANLDTWLRVLLIIVGFVHFLLGVCFCLLIEKDAGFYECKYCHHKHIPSFKSIFFASHIGRTRYLKCPNCSKKSWQKKVIK